MDIPDDDSDLLGRTCEEVSEDLSNRDVIITHGLIDELTPGVEAKVDSSSCEQMVTDYLSQSTAWLRIQAAFPSDPILKETELGAVGRRAYAMPIIIGGLTGLVVGFMRVFSAYDEFVRSNALTVWLTPEMAKRMAADNVSLSALKLGLSTGLKATSLAAGCVIPLWFARTASSFSAVPLSTLPIVLSAVNGKSSFWEYAVGWGTTCSLYCLNRGRRPMLVAGLAAGLPGLLYGSVNLLVARQLGFTFEDLYRKQTDTLMRQRIISAAHFHERTT